MQHGFQDIRVFCAGENNNKTDAQLGEKKGDIEMEDMMFKIFVMILALVLLASVVIILVEIIAHRKENDSKRFRQRLQFMRPYKDGYAFMDNEEISKAMQVMYITGDYIEFSDTGVNGKYHKIWSF